MHGPPQGGWPPTMVHDGAEEVGDTVFAPVRGSMQLSPPSSMTSWMLVGHGGGDYEADDNMEEKKWLCCYLHLRFMNSSVFYFDTALSGAFEHVTHGAISTGHLCHCGNRSYWYLGFTWAIGPSASHFMLQCYDPPPGGNEHCHPSQGYIL